MLLLMFIYFIRKKIKRTSPCSQATAGQLPRPQQQRMTPSLSVPIYLFFTGENREVKGTDHDSSQIIRSQTQIISRSTGHDLRSRLKSHGGVDQVD